MKKIPTLFVRQFYGHKIVGITDEITPGCEEAFKNGIATVKWDGTCCAVIDGVFYKRYDAKKGKTPPEGAISCCEPDPMTGHWPHWVKVDISNPENKYLVKAYKYTLATMVHSPYNLGDRLSDGTYEAIGPHIQGNPYNLPCNSLIRHDECSVRNPWEFERTFESIKDYLSAKDIEGIVFWLNEEPVCKIKRSDFGLEWPVKRKE